MQKYIDYNGERFHLQSSKRYYQSGDKTSKVRLLHRRVWTDHKGQIPDGHEVHHKDEDWSNNHIDNLECLPALEHQRQHMAKRYLDSGYKKQVDGYLRAAQEKAKEWHASPEGLAWHSKNGKEVWENKKPVKAVCTVCSKDYETYFPSRSRFCSQACEKAEGYKRHKTATGTCLVCGAGFAYNKYRTQECCSRDCSNKLRGMRKRGVVETKQPSTQTPTAAGY